MIINAFVAVLGGETQSLRRLSSYQDRRYKCLVHLKSISSRLSESPEK